MVFFRVKKKDTSKSKNFINTIRAPFSKVGWCESCSVHYSGNYFNELKQRMQRQQTEREHQPQHSNKHTKYQSN